jgi:hypothetical protein
MPLGDGQVASGGRAHVVIPAFAGALVFSIVSGAVAGSAGGWQAPATRCEVMAGSLRMPSALHGVVADLCRRSPTFRRQVARLTDAAGLRVTVRLVVVPSTSAWRAQTVIVQVGGHVQSADVQVPAGHTRLVAELIAHEFEHILEQLDGVDLKQWVGRSGVRRIGTDQAGGLIETERAHQVGRLVAGEYAAASAEMTSLRVR